MEKKPVHKTSRLQEAETKFYGVSKHGENNTKLKSDIRQQKAGISTR
jgi:hypothetical protein